VECRGQIGLAEGVRDVCDPRCPPASPTTCHDDERCRFGPPSMFLSASRFLGDKPVHGLPGFSSGPIEMPVRRVAEDDGRMAFGSELLNVAWRVLDIEVGANR